MSGPWEKFAKPPPAPAGSTLTTADPTPGPWSQFQGNTEDDPTIGEVASGALTNLPKSALGVAEGMIQPIIHPIDTFENLTELARGIGALETPKQMAKVTLPNGQTVFQPQQAPETDEERVSRETASEPALAVGRYLEGRYGSMSGFKKALRDDPAGVAMDIGTLLSGGAAAAGKAGVLSKIPGLAKVAKLDPVTMASSTARKTASGAEAVGSHTLGHLTGGGPEAIRAAAKAGYDGELKFIQALDGQMPLEDTVKAASTAISNMRKQRNEQYELLKKTVSKDPTILDFQPILKAWDDVEKVGTYEGVPLYRSTAPIRTEVKEILDLWHRMPPEKFHTVEGMDALKKKLGDVLDRIPFDNKSDRLYVNNIKRAVTKEITDQAPDYAKLMKDYHQASEALEEIERALSLGEKATYDIGIRKLLSAMRNNANTNYGNRLKMVDALEEAGAKGLKASLAGAQMSSGFPRGLAGRNPALTGIAAMFHPGALAALPLESPKLVGRGLYKAGQGVGGLRDILEATIVPAAGIPAGTPEWAARLLYQAGKGGANE